MCIATMKSMTAAIRAKKALDGVLRDVYIVNIDPSLTKKGCAYGVSFPCRDSKSATLLLEKRKISYGTLLGGTGGAYDLP